MNERPDMLKPTLIAGAVFGTAAAIPVVNFLNCACCALVWGCGLFAAYLYSQACARAGVAFEAGHGALVGLIAGAFYALATTVVGLGMTAAFGDLAGRMLLDMMERVPQMPAEARQAMREAAKDMGKITVLGTIFGFFLNVLIAAVFSTLGGVIGGAAFRVAPRPPQAPPAPPAPPSAWGGPDQGGSI